jgi:hypothetical protein
MNKLARSAGAAALAAAAVAAGALASACGTGAAHSDHPSKDVRTVVTEQQPTQPKLAKQADRTGGSTGVGGDTGSSRTGTTGTTPPPPPPVPQTITVLPPTAAAPVPATPAGAQHPASQIPWSKVGPGWTVAVWSPTTITLGHGPGNAVSELVLVDPAGQAYVEDTFSAGAVPTIDDWSGNMQNVLVTVWASHSPTLMDIDLVNGATVSRIDVPSLQSVSFTHPDGLGLLIEQAQVGHAPVLARTNLEGGVQMTFTGQSGPALYTSDGTQLVVAAQGGLRVVTNGGTEVANLAVGGASSCSPLSWWASGQVLASCQLTGTSDYYLVPTSGAAPTILGPAIGGAPYDKVEKVGGSVFANLPACSTIELVKLVDGQWQSENVPGAVPGSSQVIVGAYGNLLEVDATPSCGESRLQQPSLYWYDPADNTSSLLFGSTHGGGVVYDALGLMPYPPTADIPVANA